MVLFIANVLRTPFVTLPQLCLLVLIICHLVIKGLSATVQCFCTSKDHPCQEPICEGSWCLVGFKNDVDLVQTCGTDSARGLSKCAKKLNEWQEVCSCQEDFCNTFSHLRARLKTYDQDPDARKMVEDFDTNNLVDLDALQKSNKKPPKNQHLILLLVIVPLGVGALAVCLIFVNYHCKMC